MSINLIIVISIDFIALHCTVNALCANAKCISRKYFSYNSCKISYVNRLVPYSHVFSLDGKPFVFNVYKQNAFISVSSWEAKKKKSQYTKPSDCSCSETKLRHTELVIFYIFIYFNLLHTSNIRCLIINDDVKIRFNLTT